ncbi:unnamed protein product, partial [Discosporangium mesarthrocarpum]
GEVFERVGGVVTDSADTKICGVIFQGNPYEQYPTYPRLHFPVIDSLMKTGGDKYCSFELGMAINRSWHTGHRFYYRMPVQTDGMYTVRLAVIFQHNDLRRGDGVTLAESDVVKVYLQCTPAPLRVVVPPNASAMGERMGIIEFDTVALSGEIFLEIEGSYTCIGLSLVELFYRGPIEGDLGAMPTALAADPALGDQGEPAQDPDMALQASAATPASTYLPQGMARSMRALWREAGPQCASTFAQAAEHMRDLQASSVAFETSPRVAYLDEWARGQRMEQSAGRYCRPDIRTGPVGEGWTGDTRSTNEGGGESKDQPGGSVGCPGRLMGLITEALEALASGEEEADSGPTPRQGGQDPEALRGRGRGPRGRGVSGRVSLRGMFRGRSPLPDWLVAPERETGQEDLAQRVLDTGLQALVRFGNHAVHGMARVEEVEEAVTERGAMRFMGFTWDGLSVAMREMESGCSRKAVPGGSDTRFEPCNPPPYPSAFWPPR